MISAILRQHDASAVIGSASTEGGGFSFAGAEWQVKLTKQSVENSLQVTVSAEVTSGSAKQTSVGLCIEFVDWSTDAFLLLPGVIYAGNRFESRKLNYSPRHPEAECGPNTPPLIADIPHLRTGFGPSRLQLLAGALTTPCVAMFDPRHGTGWILLAPANVGPDEIGFDFVESDDRHSARLSVTAPGVRERRYQFMNSNAESPDRGRDFVPGEGHSISVRIESFPCANIQELFDRVFSIRKTQYPPGKTPTELPYSAVFDLIETHYNRDFWSEHDKLYHTNVTDEWSNNPYQTGWCGGIIAEYALLAGGAADLTRSRCIAHLDRALGAGITPGGLFFARFTDGDWQCDGLSDPAHPWRKDFTLVRRQGDALLYALRAMDALEAIGENVPQAWLDNTRRVADALIRIWQKDHQFGHWLDQFSGRVTIGNSASGAVIPAALCAAERRFGTGRFVETARESAEFFYQNFTRNGFSTGGPGDALQCPDSESSYALVESFIELNQITLDPLWLARAGEAARQFATWVVSYDYRFPLNTEFGKLGIKTTGAVFANSQNGHASPGICTHSGVGLLKLFRATGDARYLDLLSDITRFLPQTVSREDRPIYDKQGQPLPSGWINERCNTSDWDDNLGGVFYGPCWCEVSALLTRAEVPGIYAQPDTRRISVLDHLDVTWSDDDGLKISNPTAWPARVTLLMETSARALHDPLPAPYKLPVVEISAGATLEWRG